MRVKSKFSVFERKLSWLLSVVMIFGLFVVNNVSEVKVNATNFTPRMSAPDSSNPYYSSLNPFKGQYAMPNCTCYAFGRAYELLGSEPNLSRKNAGQWWYYNKNNGIYDYGSTPKLGAVACWDRYDQDRGHVAVVEAINGNSVTISESHYQSTYFDTRVINADSSNYLTYMRFLGYIYIGDFNIEPPTNLSIKIDKTQYAVGENVTFNFTSENATTLAIPIDVNGKRKHWLDVAGKSSYTTSFDEPGFYYFALYGKNSVGDSMTDFYLFTVYDSKPTDLSISSDKTQYAVGENVTFNFTSENATELGIPIDVNGKRKHWLDVAGKSSYTTSFDEPGFYYFALYGKNSVGDSMTDFYLFTVYDSKPTDLSISSNKTQYAVGENATFNFTSKNATELGIPIDVNGKRKHWLDVAGKSSYTTSFDEPGYYYFALYGKNNFGDTITDFYCL